MLKLVIILCVFFSATTANAWELNLFRRVQGSVDGKINFSINEVTRQYSEAKKKADTILDQLQSGAPLESSPEKPKDQIIRIGVPFQLDTIKYHYSDPSYNRAVECYEFLKERRNTSIETVDACSEIQFELGTNCTEEIKKAKDEILASLVSCTAEARKCGEITEGFLAKVKASWCTYKVGRKASDAASKAESIFSNNVERLQNLLDTYISTVGQCVALKDPPPTTAGSWSQPCKN